MAVLMPSLHALRYACACSLAVFAIAAAAEPLEYAVKAAYLTKFGIYVDWPDMPAANSPINLCIAGEDPFGKALDSAAAGQQPGGRPIMVRRLKAATRESGCQIVYVAGSEPAAAQTVEALRGSSVLTVSDARDSGAVINFVIQDNRVRFEIDAAAAERNNLVLSSKLLALAVNVKGKR